jgi:hypothetical protein
MSLHLIKIVHVPTSNGLERGMGSDCWHLLPPIKIGDDPIGIYNNDRLPNKLSTL